MRRHPVALAAAILGVLTALWALDAVLGHGIFWAHDLRHHHMPWRYWAAQEWLAGRVPLWAPGVANGFPLLADGQAGILYPPTMILFMVLPPALALNWTILLHTWWAGLGAFLLARSHKLRFEAALLGGIAFGFSGFLTSHTVYLGMQNAVAWLPWALWAIMDRRWGWLGIATFMMCTAGHPQAAAFGLLLCGAVTLWQRQLLPFAIVVGLGLVAASPQLLATLELTHQGLRSGGVDASFADIGALPPQELLGGILPDLFGHDTPAQVLQTYYHRGEGYWGQGLNHWEMCFFLGVPAVALSAFALRRRFAFWWVVAVLSGLLMLGGLTPLWPLLHHVPGLDGFRFPVRFSLVLTLAVSVLAALGSQAALDAPAALRRRGVQVLVGAAALLLVGLVSARGLLALGQEPLRGRLTAHFERHLEQPPLPPEIESNPLKEVLFPGAEPEDPTRIPAKVQHILDDLAWSTTPWSPRVLYPVGMLLGVALVLALRERLGATRSGLLLAALLYADLWHFGAAYNGRYPRAFAESRPELLSHVDGNERVRLSVVDRRRDPELDVQLITSSLGLVYGTHDVILTSPLLILRTETLLWRAGLDVGDRGPQKWDRLFAHPALVDILGLRWLTSVHLVQDPGIRHVADTANGRVHLYENPDPRPAAWLAGCARVASPEQVDGDPVTFLDALDPDRPLVELPQGEQLDLPACGAAAVPAGTVTQVLDEPQHLGFEVQASRPALILQNDTWYPGWVATVDGQVVPLRRALFAFRGLRVPAGHHKVELVYQPERLRAALVASPIALLTLGVWTLLQVPRRRRRAAPEHAPAAGVEPS